MDLLKTAWLQAATGFFRPRRYTVFTDGAVGAAAVGLAAVVRDEHGQVVRWFTAQAGPMTNNEAEFSAAILALEGLRQARPVEVTVFSDSQVLVDGMSGRASIRSPRLAPLHRRLRWLVAQFKQVRFQHVPRQHNTLADALAADALENGRRLLGQRKERG